MELDKDSQPDRRRAAAPGDDELRDQLFKLKFQLNMGQTESLKKIRELRKDIARVKTIARERELGIAARRRSIRRARPRKEATKTRAKKEAG